MWNCLNAPPMVSFCGRRATISLLVGKYDLPQMTLYDQLRLKLYCIAITHAHN